MSDYVILGIHDEDVETVSENVARVRLFINPDAEAKEDRFIDEDFPLPALGFTAGKVDTATKHSIYTEMLDAPIKKRLAELENKK